MFLITPVFFFIQTILVFIWDFGVIILNFILPRIKVGHVTPKGHPGANGKWPEYIPPKEGDSRCGCPALNTLANHGILPHDGKNIAFKDITSTVRSTFNIGLPITYFVPTYAANILKKSYFKDTFDLAELKVTPNGIEHDASITRADGVDPASPHIEYVKEFLALASGKDNEGNPLLTLKDVREYATKRRVDAKTLNPDFSLKLTHRFFGSADASTLLSVFGGRVGDLDIFLTEQRLPDGWESRVRSRFGLSFAAFVGKALMVEKGINEKKYRATHVPEVEGETDKKEV